MSAKTELKDWKKSKRNKLQEEKEPPTKKKSFIIGLAIFSAIFCPFTVAAGYLAKVWVYTGGGIICGLPIAFLAGIAVALPAALVFSKKASE
jgi:hypothetical protein